jgi:hypothetical protein
MPTRTEWLDEQSRKTGGREVVTKFGPKSDPQKIKQGRK